MGNSFEGSGGTPTTWASVPHSGSCRVHWDPFSPLLGI